MDLILVVFMFNLVGSKTRKGFETIVLICCNKIFVSNRLLCVYDCMLNPTVRLQINRLLSYIKALQADLASMEDVSNKWQMF